MIVCSCGSSKASWVTRDFQFGTTEGHARCSTKQGHSRDHFESFIPQLIPCEKMHWNQRRSSISILDTKEEANTDPESFEGKHWRQRLPEDVFTDDDEDAAWKRFGIAISLLLYLRIQAIKKDDDRD